MDKVLMRLELSYNTGKEKTKVINIPMNLTINDLESIILDKVFFPPNNFPRIGCLKQTSLKCQTFSEKLF